MDALQKYLETCIEEYWYAQDSDERKDFYETFLEGREQWLWDSVFANHFDISVTDSLLHSVFEKVILEHLDDSIEEYRALLDSLAGKEEWYEEEEDDTGPIEETSEEE